MASEVDVSGPNPNSNGSTEGEPASALMPTNAKDDLAEWTLVCSNAVDLSSLPNPGAMVRNYYPILIDRQPAVLAVEDVSTGYPLGRVHRFNGRKWSEFASQSFPFGSISFRAETPRDGMTSYLVATTSTGAAQVYVVDRDLVSERQKGQGPYRSGII